MNDRILSFCSSMVQDEQESDRWEFVYLGGAKGLSQLPIQLPATNPRVG